MAGMFALLSIIFTSGCASQKEFMGLKTEVDALKIKNDQLEKTIGTISSDKSQALKNQASIQAQNSDLQSQIRDLQGKIEEMSAVPRTDLAKLSDLEKRVKLLEDSLKTSIQGTASKSQYEAAMEKFKSGKYLEALKAFDAYIAGNPRGDLADNANFWAGECLFAEGNYESAIDRYDVVLKNFPKSSKVPDSLYKQGAALMELGDREAGNLLFKKVINEYPDSEAAKKAKSKLTSKPAKK